MANLPSSTVVGNASGHARTQGAHTRTSRIGTAGQLISSRTVSRGPWPAWPTRDPWADPAGESSLTVTFALVFPAGATLPHNYDDCRGTLGAALPARFLDTRNQAAEGQVPEANSTDAKLAIEAAGTSAQAAAIPMLNRKLARGLRLDLLGLGRHLSFHTWKRTTRSLGFCAVSSLGFSCGPLRLIARFHGRMAWRLRLFNGPWPPGGTAGQSGAAARGLGHRFWLWSRS
jgi:hypothetical protein